MDEKFSLEKNMWDNIRSRLTNIKDFENQIKKQIKAGNKTLLLTIVDLQNSTRYIGVKLK